MVPTTDLCDANEERIADGRLQFSPRIAFAGPGAALTVFEDKALVADAVRTPGAGRILVIDGGASLRCALVGGNLAKAAAAACA